MSLRILAPLGIAVLVTACSPGAPQGASSAQPSGSTVATATPLQYTGPRPPRGEAAGGSPRRGDPQWQRALAGDPLDVAALAEVEGATGLLEGVEDGGDLMRVALEALPLAPDAEIALGRLGELASLDDASVAEPALAALHLIAGAAPSRGEPLDPDGIAAAARTVMGIAARADLPRERRARAVSAARAFAERGVLDPDRIPADLDPTPTPGAAP